jgi:hypothetical protein
MLALFHCSEKMAVAWKNASELTTGVTQLLICALQTASQIQLLNTSKTTPPVEIFAPMSVHILKDSVTISPIPHSPIVMTFVPVVSTEIFSVQGAVYLSVRKIQPFRLTSSTIMDLRSKPVNVLKFALKVAGAKRPLTLVFWLQPIANTTLQSKLAESMPTIIRGRVSQEESAPKVATQTTSAKVVS